MDNFEYDVLDLTEVNEYEKSDSELVEKSKDYLNLLLNDKNVFNRLINNESYDQINNDEERVR